MVEFRSLGIQIYIFGFKVCLGYVLSVCLRLPIFLHVETSLVLDDAEEADDNKNHNQQEYSHYEYECIEHCLIVIRRLIFSSNASVVSVSC